ncbi:hypothetical protein HDE_05666 [Halotydeus destructor]|nr:hypothetical protein HDE_05666 [Halotydeus destructor]
MKVTLVVLVVLTMTQVIVGMDVLKTLQANAPALGDMMGGGTTSAPGAMSAGGNQAGNSQQSDTMMAGGSSTEGSQAPANQNNQNNQNNQ